MTGRSPAGRSDGVAALAPAHLDTGNVTPLLRRYRLGLALSCSGIAMVFVAFSSAYIVRRGIPTYDLATGAYSTTWEPLQLPIGLLLVGTMMLLAASGTMEVSRRSGGGVISFVIVSALLVLAFMGMLGAVWHDLGSSGQFMNSGARAAFFYVLTGTHAGLALLGVGTLFFVGIRRNAWSRTGLHTAVDLTALYVHFVTGLWVYLLLFLLFA
jgi:heme/copper-type cytochrome/quinol oxidase subunit 3